MLLHLEIDNLTELSPYQRGLIVGRPSIGLTTTRITRELKLDRGTVRYALEQAPLRYNGRTKGRKAREKSYTDAEERLVIRHVRLNPKDTYKQVLTATGVVFKTTTLKKMLKAASITK